MAIQTTKQYDLFGYTESVEDQIHKLKVNQEKIRRSFFVRYNLVLKDLERIDAELEELRHEQKLKVVK